MDDPGAGGGLGAVGEVSRPSLSHPVTAHVTEMTSPIRRIGEREKKHKKAVPRVPSMFMSLY